MHFHCHCSVTRFTVWDDARTSPHPHPDPVYHTLHLFSGGALGTALRLPLPGGGRLPAGAYYYPWYAAPAQSEERGWMRQALRGRLTPRQLPALGVYSSRDPRVIGAHIEQSRRAGLDFWAVSWWGPGKREDRALRDHILKHPQAESLQYAILYESTGRLGSFEQPNYDSLIPDFEYLNQHLFSHPQYLRIQGKPVVFLYLTRVYFRNRGQEALAALRSRFPNLYLIGDEVFGPGYRGARTALGCCDGL